MGYDIFLSGVVFSLLVCLLIYITTKPNPDDGYYLSKHKSIARRITASFAITCVFFTIVVTQSCSV